MGIPHFPLALPPLSAKIPHKLRTFTVTITIYFCMKLQKIKTHLFPKGFTLIELIVVITILAILGTIGFLSVGGYSSKARDSARIGDAAQISKSLDLSIVTAGSFHYQITLSPSPTQEESFGTKEPLELPSCNTSRAV